MFLIVSWGVAQGFRKFLFLLVQQKLYAALDNSPSNGGVRTKLRDNKLLKCNRNSSSERVQSHTLLLID
uniref:Putative secreted protein n=1 Tax=Anopheles marajoara TaxID=58244 RepID=A0A2M4CET1_9DIPT